jgi:hypothetical protein
MLVAILVTFVLTTVLYASLGVWGLMRVIRHLQTNRAAVQAVTEHVLMPLLGRTSEQVEKRKSMPSDARLC